MKERGVRRAMGNYFTPSGERPGREGLRGGVGTPQTMQQREGSNDRPQGIIKGAYWAAGRFKKTRERPPQPEPGG